jgi:hypothetical protein
MDLSEYLSRSDSLTLPEGGASSGVVCVRRAGILEELVVTNGRIAAREDKGV